MRALTTAATGMMAQELNVQVISNNIANMRTTGFKRQRAEFQDLLYEHVTRIGTQVSTQGNILPVGIDLGSGVKTVGTPRIMTQGTLLATGNTLDLAIRGEGFFKIQMPDGTFTYTRDGSFMMDATGRIVNPQGNVVQPTITIPTNATSISINPQGQVSVTVPGSTTPSLLGQLTLTTFVNKARGRPTPCRRIARVTTSRSCLPARRRTTSSVSLTRPRSDTRKSSKNDRTTSMLCAGSASASTRPAILRRRSAC